MFHARPVLAVLICGALATGCGAAFMEAQMSYARRAILQSGDYELSIEAQVQATGIAGLVKATGCMESGYSGTPDAYYSPDYEAPANDEVSGNALDSAIDAEFARVEAEIAWVEAEIDAQFYGIVDNAPSLAVDEANAAKPPGTSGATVSSSQFCDTFPVSGASIIVRYGNEEVTVTTDEQGQFRVAEGPVLARLVQGGGQGQVVATFQGREARVELGGESLNEAAALALLDAMTQPTLDELSEFIVEWAATPAAELALTRHRDVACGSLRDEWTQAMRTGDLARVRSVLETYGAEYQALFCDTCAAECRAIDGANDFAAELASF
ncbi:MAG: hypothetical protein KGO50_03515 [Myxococcales bacterium]|nr:hypothetical protein [Myxococcales bacterium]